MINTTMKGTNLSCLSCIYYVLLSLKYWIVLFGKKVHVSTTCTLYVFTCIYVVWHLYWYCFSTRHTWLILYVLIY